MPLPLVIIAWLSLVIAGISAVAITAHIAAGHRQQMAIMSIVWPLTALYAGPLALWAYFKYGTQSTHHAMHAAEDDGEPMPAKARPFPITVGLATTHCGSGCTLGDMIAEALVWLSPGLLTWFGLHTLWEHRIFASWVLDFALAFFFGIVFQYFTIVPMRKLSPLAGLAAALKADTLSLIAWQVGMYGWMAIATFLIFRQELPKNSPVFWFIMQLAMLLGYATSYPVNWWLVRSGIKEEM